MTKQKSILVNLEPEDARKLEIMAGMEGETKTAFIRRLIGEAWDTDYRNRIADLATEFDQRGES
jgi:hypothetical protein